MVRISKRMKSTHETLDRTKSYSLEESVAAIAQFPKVKFDETVELHFHLNIDPKSSDQMVRGTIVLPHGTGKKIRIAVFCKGPEAEQAKELGADHVGAEDLIAKVAQGFLDFDRAIATPDIMKDLSKLGKVLGPRGLMPSPKAGTVTKDIAKAITEVRAGRIEFKSDKQAGIHVGIGKRSFSADQLRENAKQVIDAIDHAKPAAVKGNLVKSVSMSTTMGSGVKIAL